MSTTYLPNNVYNIDGYDFFVQDFGASYAIQTIKGRTRSSSRFNPATSGRATPRAGSAPTRLDGEDRQWRAYPHVLCDEYCARFGEQRLLDDFLGQFHQNDYDGAPALSPPFSVGLDGQKMTESIGYTGADGQPVYLTLFRDAQPYRGWPGLRDGHQRNFQSIRRGASGRDSPQWRDNCRLHRP